MLTCAVLLFTAALPIAADEPAKDAKEELSNLQGEWALVSMEIAGNKREGDAVKGMKLVIKGNEWTAPGGGAFTLKIDPTKNPKELDLVRGVMGRENVWRGIYKIEGDTLTFCRSHGAGGERPKDFKGGEGVALLVFKRAGK